MKTIIFYMTLAAICIHFDLQGVILEKVGVVQTGVHEFTAVNN